MNQFLQTVFVVAAHLQTRAAFQMQMIFTILVWSYFLDPIHIDDSRTMDTLEARRVQLVFQCFHRSAHDMYLTAGM